MKGIMNFKARFFFLFVFFSLVGCANQVRINNPDRAVLRGVFFEEFERNELLGCDGERYFVVNPEKLRALNEQVERQKKPFEVAVQLDRVDPVGRINGYHGAVIVLHAKMSENSAACDVLQP
jgi:hypothetical protein